MPSTPAQPDGNNIKPVRHCFTASRASMSAGRRRRRGCIRRPPGTPKRTASRAPPPTAHRSRESAADARQHRVARIDGASAWRPAQPAQPDPVRPLTGSAGNSITTAALTTVPRAAVSLPAVHDKKCSAWAGSALATQRQPPATEGLGIGDAQDRATVFQPLLEKRRSLPEARSNATRRSSEALQRYDKTAQALAFGTRRTRHDEQLCRCCPTICDAPGCPR